MPHSASVSRSNHCSKTSRRSRKPPLPSWIISIHWQMPEKSLSESQCIHKEKRFTMPRSARYQADYRKASSCLPDPPLPFERLVPICCMSAAVIWKIGCCPALTDYCTACFAASHLRKCRFQIMLVIPFVYCSWTAALARNKEHKSCRSSLLQYLCHLTQRDQSESRTCGKLSLLCKGSTCALLACRTSILQENLQACVWDEGKTQDRISRREEMRVTLKPEPFFT